MTRRPPKLPSTDKPLHLWAQEILQVARTSMVPAPRPSCSRRIPGTIFAAGDLAYERGTAAEFQNCYDTTWGEFKARTRPVPGNHEYAEGGASAYFQYWGTQAGPAGKGYYSYDLGSWHIVALNTNCIVRGLGGCAKGSPEEEWLASGPRWRIRTHASSLTPIRRSSAAACSRVMPSTRS